MGMRMLQELFLISLLGFTWTAAAGLPCSQMDPSHPPPTTVNSVRPADVAVLSSIGFDMHSAELSKVTSRLRELMTLFNPELISHLSDEANLFTPQVLQHSTLVEQAKEVSLYVHNIQNIDVNQDWKLVLLFVQVDQLCACEQQEQVSAVIRSVVGDVDEALQLLHTQLKRTIVSVALWDGEHDSIQCKKCPCVEMKSEGELRIMRAMLTQVLQESLDELMVQKQWYSDRDDFAVTLQGTPYIKPLSSVASGKSLSESKAAQHTDKLMIQMWANLLQPTVGQHKTDDNENIFTLPCPTKDQPFLRTEGNSPTYHHSSDASLLLQAPTGTVMPCEDLSPSASIPTSVHELRPGDIKVVAAVGDSLTAGNGIASGEYDILDVLRQYRGLSWSIGGDGNLTTVTTLPNILKYFNPNVTGYSVGTGSPQSPQAFLNQAVPGAKSREVPAQVRALVARMKSDSRINFELDWKVITVFIGGNDFCDHCYNSLLYSVENYVKNVRESLDYLKKEVPRALVNLVEPLHIIPLREMHTDTTLNCPTWLVDYMCPCVIFPEPNSEALQLVEDLIRNYQRVLHELVESGRYDNSSDFTVVIQPFFREVLVPRTSEGHPDRTFFSADCFHLSQKSQTLMARSLWNNMLEPLGNKTHVQDFNESVDLICPTETSPYIRTYNNSNYVYSGPSPTPGPIPNWGSSFSCADVTPSDTIPTSVHKLRPADIKVVAALGDSTTAGTGAKANSYIELTRNYKGVSWSIGGDQSLDTVTTLPNILRKFNPSLKGFSTGGLLGEKGFNMAASGAQSSEIPAQVEALIKAMREDKEVDFENDWKLVTLFVGGNDLCNYCLDQNNLSPKNFSYNLMLSLNMLYNEVPRLLVNVVQILQIDVVRSVKRNTLACSLLQRTSCPCVISPFDNSPELEDIKLINYKYQTEMQNLISGDRYNGKEDFAVVLQPFLQNSFIPLIGEGEVDASFFSIDCFHISERAHAEMAIALWNNMLEPVGSKQGYNNFTYDRSKIHCPSETSPFIFTSVNSLPSPPQTTTTTGPTTTTTGPTTTMTVPTTWSRATTTLVPVCPSSVPVWVPVVVGIASLLIGIAVAWLFLSRIQHKKIKDKKGAEMKGTDFVISNMKH